MLSPGGARLATSPLTEETYLAIRAGEFQTLSPPIEIQQFRRGPFAPGNGHQNARPPLLKRLTGILRLDASSRWWRIATDLTLRRGRQVPALIAPPRADFRTSDKQSVTTVFGARPCFRISLRMSLTAARRSRRR